MLDGKKYIDDIEVKLREALLSLYPDRGAELIYDLAFVCFQQSGITPELSALYTGYITPLPLAEGCTNWFDFYKTLLYPITRLIDVDVRKTIDHSYSESLYPYLGRRAFVDTDAWTDKRDNRYTTIKAYAPNPVQALHNSLHPRTTYRPIKGAPVNIMNWKKGQYCTDEETASLQDNYYLVAPLRSLIYNTGSILVPVLLLPRLLESYLKGLTSADADFTSDNARIYWVRNEDMFYFCSADKQCVGIKMGTIEEARAVAFQQLDTIMYYANQFEDSRTLATPKSDMAIKLTDINLYITHIQAVEYDTISKFCVPSHRVY